MQEDDLRASTNIEDRRGGGGGGLGGGGMRAGGLGLGAVIVLSLVGYAFGIDPSVLINGAEQVTGNAPRQQQASNAPAQRGTPDDKIGQFVARVLGETEDVWSQVLPQEAQRQYQKPTLVLYSGVTQSGCGTAQSAMGPFYCPDDRKVYLDTAFFRDMQQKLGGGGDFAYAYVISHEIGHHVQNLLGLLPKVQEAERNARDKATANDLSVRTELQADCFAGVWAHHMNERHHNISQDDLRQAVATATAIGDDRLQQASGRSVVPDSFTHGSSEQRVRWLSTGLEQGTIASCNTFGR